MGFGYCRRWPWLIVALAVLRASAGEERESPPEVTPPLIEIRVLDVMLAGTNRLQFGRELVSLNAVSNRIEQSRANIDAVVVHAHPGFKADQDARNEALAKLARVGLPLVIVEDGKAEGEYAWRTPSGTDGIRAIKISTDQLAVLRHQATGSARTAGGPVLQTTVDWDAATGSYQFNRIELGLFGKRVWIMHVQSDSDEAGDSLGVEIKKEW